MDDFDGSSSDDNGFLMEFVTNKDISKTITNNNIASKLKQTTTLGKTLRPNNIGKLKSLNLSSSFNKQKFGR